MKPVWKSTFLLWSETDEYLRKVADAKETIRNISHSRKCYCSYSGGKDSTVLTHLCLSVDPEMLVFHWVNSRWQLPTEIENVVLKNLDSLGAKNKLIETSVQYDNYERELPFAIFGRVMFGRIEPMLIDRGYNCCFLGLRSEESGKRSRRLKKAKDVPGRIETVSPLKEWSWKDVWAYVVSHNLPCLSWYDVQSDIGIGYDRSRFGTFYMDATGCSNVDAVLLPEHLHQWA
jgi:3'-phosphoadenosine 5'-phosphosulfate sulfotransferase (PAPS reductase)/FAD synthetase